MDFFSALKLMLPSFTLCVLMVGMLSYLGIHVIKREIIFVDLALAQIAALGALIGLMLGIPLHTGGSYLFSVTLAAMAAIVFSISRVRHARVPQEAVIGLAYAIAAATAIILMDKAPHGAEHIKDILTGSILWVKWATVGQVAAVYGVVGLFHYLYRRRFVLISENPNRAEAEGVNLRLWDFLFYLSFGFVITITVPTAGVLLVFVFLVAPAVAAVLITSRLGRQLAVGWVLGFAVTVCGLVASYLGDLSSGPLVIAAYAVALIAVCALVYLLRAENRRTAVRNLALLGIIFAVVSFLMVAAGRRLREVYRHAGHEPHAGEVAEPESSGSAGSPSGRAHETEVAPGTDRTSRPEAKGFPSGFDIQIRFEEEENPGRQADLVREALERDPGLGAELAIRFLKRDPPLFFRQAVVAALDSMAADPFGYDIAEPSGTPANRAAVARIRTVFGVAERGTEPSGGASHEHEP
jgi:zinc/manganese transport system permease protein